MTHSGARQGNEAVTLVHSAVLSDDEKTAPWIFEEAAIGVSQVEVHTGRYVKVNRSLCELTGYTREELLARSYRDITHPDDSLVDQELVNQMLAGQIRSFTVEKRYVRKDGRVIWVQVTVSPLWAAGETPTYDIGIINDITERKLAEEALRKLWRAVEQNPASIVITDTTGAIEYVNPKFTQTSGYTLQESLGKNPRFLKSGTLPPEEYARLWQTISAGKEWRGEFCNRKKTGEFYWEAASISPVTDPDGNITHYIAVKEDITERKQIEAELNKSLARAQFLAEVLDSAAQPFCIAYPDGRLELANLALCQLLGYTAAELTTLGWRSMITPEHDPESALAELHRTKEAHRYHTACLRKDGSLVPVEIFVHLRNDGLREEPYYYTFITDITERVREEAENAHRLAELETVRKVSTGLRAARNMEEILPLFLDLTLAALDATHGCLWLFESDSDMLRLVALRGCANADDIQPAQTVKPGQGVIGTVYATGEAITARDFTTLWHAAQAPCQKPVLNAGGAILPIRSAEKTIGVFVIHVPLPRELTPAEIHLLTALSEIAGTAIQRTMLYEAVRQHAAELEQRVAERTAELSQREAALQAANEKLKELDRMKSQFVSDVSHELRTPITTIKLYASLLRKGPADRREKFLAALEQEANRQATLIEEILEISRIESGRLDLRYALHILNDLALASVAGREMLAAERGVTLRYEPHKPGPVIWADGVRMMEVIDNLIENAIWYTPAGGRVHVTTAISTLDGQAWAILRVADTGMGISPDELPHIFERFYRGHKPRELQLPGSGLGLAITKDIVELHQGRVTVESRVGQGSCFTVWLPLIQGQPDERHTGN